MCFDSQKQQLRPACPTVLFTDDESVLPQCISSAGPKPCTDSGLTRPWQSSLGSKSKMGIWGKALQNATFWQSSSSVTAVVVHVIVLAFDHYLSTLAVPLDMLFFSILSSPKTL